MNRYAKTPSEYANGLMAGVNKFKFGSYGNQNMTMNTPMGNVPYPIQYKGYHNGKQTDQGIAQPGENFNVKGSEVHETPMYQAGGNTGDPIDEQIAKLKELYGDNYTVETYENNGLIGISIRDNNSTDVNHLTFKTNEELLQFSSYLEKQPAADRHGYTTLGGDGPTRISRHVNGEPVMNEALSTLTAPDGTGEELAVTHATTDNPLDSDADKVLKKLGIDPNDPNAPDVTVDPGKNSFTLTDKDGNESDYDLTETLSGTDTPGDYKPEKMGKPDINIENDFKLAAPEEGKKTVKVTRKLPNGETVHKYIPNREDALNGARSDGFLRDSDRAAIEKNEFNPAAYDASTHSITTDANGVSTITDSRTGIAQPLPIKFNPMFNKATGRQELVDMYDTESDLSSYEDVPTADLNKGVSGPMAGINTNRIEPKVSPIPNSGKNPDMGRINAGPNRKTPLDRKIKDWNKKRKEDKRAKALAAVGGPPKVTPGKNNKSMDGKKSTEEKNDGEAHELTRGDKWGLAAQALAPAVNIGRGLFEKAKKYQSIQNPYATAAMAKMNARRFVTNRVPGQIQAAVGRQAMFDNSMNGASLKANIANMYGNSRRQEDAISIQEANQNMQLDGQAAQFAYQVGDGIRGAHEIARGYNTKSAAAKDNILTTGLGQAGNVGQHYGNTQNMKASNEVALAAINANSRDFRIRQEALYGKSKNGVVEFKSSQGAQNAQNTMPTTNKVIMKQPAPQVFDAEGNEIIRQDGGWVFRNGEWSYQNGGNVLTGGNYKQSMMKLQKDLNQLRKNRTTNKIYK